jgi:hypothetical protein
MADRERIVQAVYRAVDELNKQLPKGVSVAKSAGYAVIEAGTTKRVTARGMNASYQLC